MSSQCKVSIIVPVYNAEKYLDRCIDSLINQSLEEIEIILVNDGSQDNSGNICDSYAKEFKNIRVIHKVNAGLGYARNSGIDVAAGEYVGFVDADDFVSPDMMEILYCNAEIYNADISYGEYKRFFSLTEIKCEKNAKENECKVFEKNDIRKYLFNRIGMPPSSKKDMLYDPIVCNGIFKKSIIDENRIRFVSEREIISEDIIFDIDVIKQCRTIVHSSREVYFYWYNPNSLTTSYKKNRYKKNIELYYLINEKLSCVGKYSEYELALSRYLISFARVAIMQEAIHVKSNGVRYAIQQIKEICISKEMEMVLLTYPYKALPLKYFLFCLFEKKHFYRGLFAMAYITQIIKGRIQK